MLQKIIKVGNSAAITLPKDFLQLTHTAVGNQVILQFQPEKRRVIINLAKKKQKSVAGIIDEEVYAVAKNLLQKYLPAFKELAKR